MSSQVHIYSLCHVVIWISSNIKMVNVAGSFQLKHALFVSAGCSFLGIFVAKVLQDNRLADLPLSRPMFKLLCLGEIAACKGGPGADASVNVQSILAAGDEDSQERDADDKPWSVTDYSIYSSVNV